MGRRTVTLVDESGRTTGKADILEAHTGAGKLHKAFSVYVFRNSRQDILIQQRSKKKMLWPLIWANSCCSHPFEEESPSQAGERRLREELGLTLTLSPVADFVYRAEDPGHGVEHEHVTILRGDTASATMVTPNPDEIENWKWVNVDQLQADMKKDPDLYAPWFHQGLAILLSSKPVTSNQ